MISFAAAAKVHLTQNWFYLDMRNVFLTFARILQVFSMPPEVKHIDDFFEPKEPQSRMIRCAEVDAGFLRSRFSAETYMDAATILLITRGRVAHEINRHPTQVAAGCAVVISSSHLFRIADCSDDCSAMCLMVGVEFMQQMDSVDMIYKRIRYGVKLYAHPVVMLATAEAERIASRMRELTLALCNTKHLYYKEVVLNRLFAFYLDLSDIIDSRPALVRRVSASASGSAHYESVVKRFVELLIVHYRAEHKVDFYASQLHLSAHHLTLIVKEVTGQTVSDFIYWMLYSDARALLGDSTLSVQEITRLLNFSDQSAFTKFFKRRANLSPLDYRKNCPQGSSHQ